MKLPALVAIITIPFMAVPWSGHGQTASADPHAAALELLERACRDGNAKACKNLEVMRSRPAPPVLSVPAMQIEAPGLVQAHVIEPKATRQQRAEKGAYHVQLLAADVLSLVLAATGNELAIATYLLGGPAVHALHERPGRAAASLGVRVAAPLGTALFFAQTSSCDDPYFDPEIDLEPDCDGDEVAAIVGLALGGLAAMTFDQFLIPSTRDLGNKESVTVAPTVSPRHGGATLGLAGAF